MRIAKYYYALTTDWHPCARGREISETETVAHTHFGGVRRGVVCFHGSVVALQLLQALVEGADALAEVKVHRGHPVLHQALEVEGNPLSGQIWSGEGGRVGESGGRVRRENGGKGDGEVRDSGQGSILPLKAFIALW